VPAARRRAYIRRVWLTSRLRMQSDLGKRLLWSALIAGLGALAAIVANRLATTIWVRAFGEDPPTLT
jgi:Protein of unknown function (DUF4235)